MMEIMGLRSSPLLVFLVVLLFGSVIEIAQSYPDYTFCRPTVSSVVKLSPNSQFVINHERIHIQRSPMIDLPVSVICAISLQAGPEPLILTFDFKKLNGKDVFDLGEGSICIHGTNISNNWRAEDMIVYILPEYRTSTIYLIQTITGQGNDFKILVTTELATNSKNITEIRSFNTKRTLYSLEEHYSKGMPYIDFCNVENDALVYTLCKDVTPTVVHLTPQSPPFFIRTYDFEFNCHTFNSSCSLVLEAGHDPLVLTFYFRDFSLEDSDFCDLDYLCLNGINVCGRWVHGRMIQYILPEHRKSTIVFKMDWSIESEGFDILVTTEQADSKRVVLESRVNLELHKEPRVYYDKYDHMKPYVNKCGETQIPRVYELCHPLIFHAMRINGNSQPFIIQSPYWKKDFYPSNQNCSLDLISYHDPLILSFNYSELNVEGSTNCDHDYLCVDGYHFCGSWGKAVYENILPRGNTLTISFYSNTHTQFPGFHILVTPRRAFNNEMIQEVTKQDWLRMYVEFKNVTYHPGMHYSNKCSASRHTSTTAGRPTTHNDLATTPTDRPTTASERPTTANELLTKATELLTIATDLLTQATELFNKATELLTTVTEQPTAVTKLLTTVTELITTATELLTNATDLLTNVIGLLTTVTEQPTKANELLPTATGLLKKATGLLTTVTEPLNKATELLTKATELLTKSH